MKEKSKKYVPTFFIIAISFLTCSYLLLFLCQANPRISDFLNRYFLQYIRLSLAALTSFLPFSLFELFLLLLIPLLVIFIVLTVKYTSSLRERVRRVLLVASIICLVLSLHIYTLGIAYHTTSLADKLGLAEDDKVDLDELYSTTVLVRDKVNELARIVNYSDGESRMPYSFAGLSEHICSAYDTLEQNYPIFENFPSFAKPIKHSSIMSDMGITGIYSYFTGEANINTEYPDYTLPFVVAHELAHQRGFARENEANFIAYLVCISSPDPYIQYSGYLNMYEYLASALYQTDRELYLEVLSGLDVDARSDIIASNEVTKAHRDSFLYKLMNKVNDTYLKANGTEGVVSYSYVVRITIAYYSQGK